MDARGIVHRYGNDIDTDVIIPARYLNIADPEELAQHCMEDIDADFVKEVGQGDIMAAGKNFGCGSSREHAPVAIKASGISLVIAESFARIFFRNCINVGLAIMECPEAAKAISKGDIIKADFDTGIIENVTKNEKYQAKPFPDFINGIIASGGLLEYTKKQTQN
jgi:3-isopropylmalate/(R)-2-methylmalate dehydratase small subunit